MSFMVIFLLILSLVLLVAGAEVMIAVTFACPMTFISEQLDARR